MDFVPPFWKEKNSSPESSFPWTMDILVSSIMRFSSFVFLTFFF